VPGELLYLHPGKVTFNILGNHLAVHLRTVHFAWLWRSSASAFYRRTLLQFFESPTMQTPIQ